MTTTGSEVRAVQAETLGQLESNPKVKVAIYSEGQEHEMV